MMVVVPLPFMIRWPFPCLFLDKKGQYISERSDENERGGLGYGGGATHLKDGCLSGRYCLARHSSAKKMKPFLSKLRRRRMHPTQQEDHEIREPQKAFARWHTVVRSKCWTLIRSKRERKSGQSQLKTTVFTCFFSVRNAREEEKSMMPALPSVANEGASLVSKKMDWTKSTWIWVILLVLQPWATHGYRQRLNNAGLVNPRQPQLQQQRPTPPIPNPNPGIVGFLGGPDPDPMRQLMYHTYRRFLALRLFKQGKFWSFQHYWK